MNVKFFLWILLILVYNSEVIIKIINKILMDKLKSSYNTVIIYFSWFILMINIAILFFWFILMINIATALFLKNYISNICMLYLLRDQLTYSNPILILFNQFNLRCYLLFSRYIFYSWSFFSYNFLLEFS
jgi:hypothetical protein